jgi:ABC-type antimicrobial peptide transport system ATPase subunit
MKQAVDSFLTVCKMQPKNADARAKYELTKKEYKGALLAAAILNEDKKIIVDSTTINVESSYSGPRLENTDEITP